MTTVDQMRKTHLQQSDELGSKPRFGLFSQPISTAIGDDGPYKTTFHPKGEDNKPLTKPRNIVTAHPRSGQGDSCYFGPLNSLSHTIKTEAEDKASIKDKKQSTRGALHQRDFIPAPTNRQLYKAAYTYKQDNPLPKNPRRNRNTQGGVISKPRNITTNSTNNIERTLFKTLNHMDDPYDNKKQFSKTKGVTHQHPFRSTAYGPRVLNKNKDVFGTEVVFKERPKRPLSHNIVNHETCFKYSNPTKWGVYGYFTPFHEYKPNPPKQRPPLVKEQGQKKQIFKTGSTAKSRPSSSITTNPMNMRRYISHSFSRRF